VTGLAWLGPDSLVVAEFGGVKPEEDHPMRKGKLHLLTGVEAARGPEGVKRQTLLEGLAQPMGLWMKDGALYLHEKGDSGTEIHKVTRNGAAWKHELYAKGWGGGDGYLWHSWPGGLVFHQGAWHFNVSSFLANSYKSAAFRYRHWPPTERGAWIRLDPATMQYKIMATGLRTNEATWIGPWQGLFTNDVQGDWMPDNKVIELREGRHYGHNYGPVATKPESPPMAYCPQGDACISPAEGIYLKKGPFQGQMLVTEFGYGGINRYSMERINGELQACIFDFGSTPRAAPYQGAHSQRILVGPDGETLYYACAGGWWVAGPTLGSIAKLMPTSRLGFEMLAIRSMGPTSFEIEFTKPVDAALAAVAGNYQIESYTREPGEAYGSGARVNRHTLAALSATVDAAKKKVRLEFAAGALSTGTVHMDAGKLVGVGYTVTFDLRTIKSATGETLFDTKAFYTLNQFGPGEVPKPGCMTAGNANFDPAANDPWPEMCAGTVALRSAAGGPARFRDFTVAPMPGGLRIRAGEAGILSLRITDARGRTVHAAESVPRGVEITRELRPGRYQVLAQSAAGTDAAQVDVLP
jgi:hypothetical protein